MRVSSIVGALTLAAGARAACSSRNWKGWEKAKHAFILLRRRRRGPSASNPLGNPYPGWTSSNGPNWVGFLTNKYNASADLRTYNLAYGGATVDSALVEPWQPTVLSLRDQVADLFLPNYAPGATEAAPFWDPTTTVFGVWIGINDVGNSFWSGDEATTELYAQIFDVYAGLVADLYAAGGRNFVFINVPPVQRSPLILGQGEEAIALEEGALAKFNALVDGLAKDLKTAHKNDANVWVYDSYKSFGDVLDDVAAYPQTAGYKDTTTFCEAYQNGTPEWDTLDESCTYPVDQYFWLNSLHPTYPIHDVVAEGVAELLSGPPTSVLK
ncbi:unnamed protein product [Parascedosporium putredinis]|uniref:Carbohydrate esterase family 16 protein n=1 Tax=Parascedosporium putredinis TaxID=1442378 RepID=A0A9P1GYY2_9PEZI|nr:unnamed protein product [Parascedosporium putredinis]CAI7992273.1 unnamed protein product [Parascedosporium putredinis]